jgi:poly [ADP-ribose] polymerase 7/11/12/13
MKCCYTTLWLWFIAEREKDGLVWQVCDSSEDIEQEYLEDRYEVFKESSTPNGFEVDFRRMVWIDRKTGIEQEVRRRPDFFDPETKRPKTVSEKITAMKQLATTTTTSDTQRNIDKETTPLATVGSLVVRFPSQWEQLSISDDSTTDCQLVTVATSDSHPPPPEYLTIVKLFNATMSGPLKSLKRIQNRDLWEDFSRLRSRLEKKRGSKLDVRRLFHGTSDQYVDTICHHGFEPRVAGMSVGTLYGKGSYFARDASYSKCYCQGGNKMFVVQVIVGEFTVGQPHFTLPPVKDSTLPLHQQQPFDSCVDSEDDPSIFVVFDRHQAYPEYLIEF